MVLYRVGRAKTLAIATGVGLAITGFPIAISAALGLEPLYLCVLVLACTFVAGKTIGLCGKKLAVSRAPPTPALDSEKEIESMLQKRGLKALIREKKPKKD